MLSLSQKQITGQKLEELLKAKEAPLPPPEDRTASITDLQTDLCAILNGSTLFAIPFYVTNRGAKTHAVVPASLFAGSPAEFVQVIEEFITPFTAPSVSVGAGSGKGDCHE